MLTYVRNAFVERVNHPVMGLMYVIAGFFLLLSGLTSVAMSNPWLPGFLGVFTVFFAAMATIAYAIVFLGKGVSIARDRMGPV